MIPAGIYAAWDAKEAGKRREGDWNGGVRAVPREVPGRGRRIRAPHWRASCRPTGPERRGDRRRRERAAARRSRRARRRSRRSRALPPCCPSCSAARPT
ncbi:hypothetical protein [Burkholderia mallei]|uniref:hypothetical protein n=1 Tax=Burkholderia mallei TaxID=13373 RepID=UPI003B97D241